MNGVRALVVVLILSLFGNVVIAVWADHRVIEQRKHDCRLTEEIRESAVQDNIDTWRDVQRIVSNPEADERFDELVEGIRARADAAADPAVCDYSRF